MVLVRSDPNPIGPLFKESRESRSGVLDFYGRVYDLTTVVMTIPIIVTIAPATF